MCTQYKENHNNIKKSLNFGIQLNWQCKKFVGISSAHCNSPSKKTITEYEIECTDTAPHIHLSSTTIYLSSNMEFWLHRTLVKNLALNRCIIFTPYLKDMHSGLSMTMQKKPKNLNKFVYYVNSLLLKGINLLVCSSR